MKTDTQLAIEKRKDDLFKKGREFDRVYKKLASNQYFKFQKNNEIIKKYIDAKWKGHYGSIIYNVNEPKSTLLKNLVVLLKIEQILLKCFDELNQDDIDNLQFNLNDGKILTHLEKTEQREISHSYKLDIVRNLKQFWAFYMHYCKREENRDIQNIVAFLKLRRRKKANKLIVFITKEEIDRIVTDVRAQQLKAFFALFFETGGRVIEMLKLQKSNCEFDRNKGVWKVVLPNEKGISTGKMPIELVYSATEFDRWMQIRPDYLGEYIFQYSYDYVKKRFYEVCHKHLKRHLTLKQIRKGTTMFLINCGASEQYIRAHMGWTASSDAISHYINQCAIKRPDAVNTEFQGNSIRNVTDENDRLKFREKIKEDEISELKEQIKAMKEAQLKMFEMFQNDIDVRNSKVMIKAVYDDLVEKS